MKKLYFIIFIFIVSLIPGCSKPTSEISKDLNVLIIVVDTLGARHLGAYGNKNSPSPVIDSLAREGTFFNRSISPAPWTKPAVASLFTGKYPFEHKVREISTPLSESAETIAEVLKTNGYQTFGRVSHTFLTPEEGYGQGFDDYRIVKLKNKVHQAVTSEQVTESAIKYLKNKQPGKFFMFLHYFDPHFNFQHHPRHSRTKDYQGTLKPGIDIRELRQLIPKLGKEDLEYLVNLYHEEIAYTDEQIGRVLQSLKEQKLDQDTLVVITADHGEEFMEHGFLGHTNSLYEELIHVPLIFKVPGISPKVIEQNVSTIDIKPTILEFLGINFSNLPGISLKNAIVDKGAVVPTGRNLFSEVDFKSSAIKAYKVGVIRDEFKLVYDKPSQTYELLNILEDQWELNNLASRFPEKVKELTPILDKYRQLQSGGVDQIEKQHTPEEVEQLKSLGYL